MRITLVILAVATLIGLTFIFLKVPGSVTLPPAISGGAHRFPRMQVKNLSDEIRTLPADFPAERTLLLIAFQREQQDNLDDWSARLKLRNPGSPAWLELPVIDDPGALLRWFVDVGMKNGISDSFVRDRVFSIYAPREDFIRHLGLPGTQQVHLVVADPSGNVLCRVSGDWSEEKQNLLRAALR
jgi:hypothetical protein